MSVCLSVCLSVIMKMHFYTVMFTAAYFIYLFRGLLKYSDKISQHWPEFAQKGKGDATIANLMTHSVSTRCCQNEP